MARRMVCFLGALCVLLTLTPVARACSCAPGDPRDKLEGADGAIIGRYEPDAVPQPPPSNSGQEVDRHFKVDEVIKGDIGDEVDVRSPYSGASCGLEVQPGEQVGLYLWRQNGRWVSNLCAQTTPDELRKAARPLPKPSGSGPTTFLLGGSMGAVRTLSLDAKGRTLAYAQGDGHTSSLSTCPGSDVFVELVTGVVEDKWWKVAVAVRDVETLELRREHRFTSFETKNGYDSIAPIDIECLDPDGATLAVYGLRDDRMATIVRIRGDDEERIFEGKVGTVDLEHGVAYVVQDTSLRAVDLRTGRVRHVGTIQPGTLSIDVSPDAKHVVFSSTGERDPDRGGHFVLDVDGRRLERLRTRLNGYGWVDDRSFVVFGKDDLVRVFDVRLHKIAQWTGWRPYDGTVRDGVVYAADMGAVLSAPVRTGPVKTLRLFEFPQSFAFEVVPPRPPRDATPGPTVSPAPVASPSSTPSPPPAASDPASAPPQALPNEPASSSGRSLGLGAIAVALALLAAGGLVRRTRRADGGS